MPRKRMLLIATAITREFSMSNGGPPLPLWSEVVKHI